MGLFAREIEFGHNGESIRFEATVKRENAHTFSTLIINGKIQDQIESTPKDGLFGCNINLKGILISGSKVRLQLITNILRRPLYRIYVNDELVFTKKGTWGGV